MLAVPKEGLKKAMKQKKCSEGSRLHQSCITNLYTGTIVMLGQSLTDGVVHFACDPFTADLHRTALRKGWKTLWPVCCSPVLQLGVGTFELIQGIYIYILAMFLAAPFK